MRFSILFWKLCWSCQWCMLWRFCSDCNWVNRWQCYVGCVCNKRSRVQSCSTHRNISLLKILIFSHSFKITFKIIVVIFIFFVHSVCCSFFSIMPRLKSVGSICKPSDSGCGDNDGPQFICCVDGRQPKVDEVWIFGEDAVTPESHPTAHIDVVALVGD